MLMRIPFLINLQYYLSFYFSLCVRYLKNSIHCGLQCINKKGNPQRRLLAVDTNKASGEFPFTKIDITEQLSRKFPFTFSYIVKILSVIRFVGFF